MLPLLFAAAVLVLCIWYGLRPAWRYWRHKD
jgi:hypothetical protein